MSKWRVTLSVNTHLPNIYRLINDGFPQILMHGSSVAAFASRIMELQAKDFFSRCTVGSRLQFD
jgi:hypothetical protein